MLETHFFISDHHIARLLGVRAAADAQVKVGDRDLEVLQDCIGHVVVVMLPSMNEHRRRPFCGFQRVIERGDLHEVGPCRSYEVNCD